MSQPYDRGCEVPSPGKPDEDLGEFWETSPWRIAGFHNLSAFERNRTFLNVEGEDFLDISYVTGADSDGDGRASLAVDLNHDGQLELLVRQAGGGSLVIYGNRFPKRHWLKVTLRGVESNRLGIGSKLFVKTARHRQMRELFPMNSYMSQTASMVHFGLGDADEIDEVEILWPSGEKQRLTNVRVDQHIVVEEGDEDFQVIKPGDYFQP